MKKITAALVAFTMAFTLVGCGGGNSDTSTTNENETDTGTETAVNETEKECITAIQEGIQKRCDFANKSCANFDEYKANVKQGIEEELNSVKDYKDADFGNKTMTKTVNNYIAALEKEKEGADYMINGDVAKFNQLFYREGNDKRKEALQSLIEHHNLILDKEYKNDFDSLKQDVYYETIGLKQIKTVEAKKGEVSVGIDSVQKVANHNGETRISILFTLENISYVNDNGTTILDTSTFMGVTDASNYLLNPTTDGFDENGYAGTGSHIELAKGEKRRFHLNYAPTEDTNIAHVFIIGKGVLYDMYIPV